MKHVAPASWKVLMFPVAGSEFARVYRGSTEITVDSNSAENIHIQNTGP